MKHRRLTRAAVLMAFAGVMAAASAAFAGPAPSLVCETPVAAGQSGAYQVESVWSDVYEGKVVYGERTNSYDIWLYDSGSGAKKKIAGSSMGEYRPAIWGDYVVYNYDQKSVKLYKISTGKTKTIAPKYAESTVVDIYRDKVVYSKVSPVTKTNDVYLYDIKTGTEKKIISSTRATGYADDRVQRIWGDNVIYVVNYQEMRVYNLKTKKSASLGVEGYVIDADAANAGPNRPGLYQNTVAYVANTPHSDGQKYLQVFTYDLATKVRTQISQDATNHASPAVYTTRVVYTRGSLYQEQLVLHDMRVNKTWDLNIGPSMDASIWGDRLAWTDMRNGTQNGDVHDEGASWGNEDIYTCTIRTLNIEHAGSMTVPYNTATGVTTLVTQPDCSSVGTGTVLGLQMSTDGITWSNEGTATTEGGRVTFTIPPISSKRYARFTYDGTDTVPATVSRVMTFTPRVAVGTPVAPATMTRNKTYSVYGTLMPQHSSGTLRIYKYKKISGVWRKQGYVTAKIYKYSTYSRYRANVKLTSKGSWRLRAFENADSKHAETWSPYKYVTVK